MAYHQHNMANAAAPYAARGHESAQQVPTAIFGCSLCRFCHADLQVVAAHTQHSNLNGSRYFTCPGCRTFASCDASPFYDARGHLQNCGPWHEWAIRNHINTNFKIAQEIFTPSARPAGVARIVHPGPRQPPPPVPPPYYQYGQSYPPAAAPRGFQPQDLFNNRGLYSSRPGLSFVPSVPLFTPHNPVGGLSGIVYRVPQNTTPTPPESGITSQNPNSSLSESSGSLLPYVRSFQGPSFPSGSDASRVGGRNDQADHDSTALVEDKDSNVSPPSLITAPLTQVPEDSVASQDPARTTVRPIAPPESERQSPKDTVAEGPAPQRELTNLEGDEPSASKSPDGLGVIAPPEQAVSSAEQAIATPEQPIATPEQPIAAPEQAVVSPDHAIASPGQPGPSPEQPSPSREQPVSSREQPVSSPQSQDNRYITFKAHGGRERSLRATRKQRSEATDAQSQGFALLPPGADPRACLATTLPKNKRAWDEDDDYFLYNAEFDAAQNDAAPHAHPIVERDCCKRRKSSK